MTAISIIFIIILAIGFELLYEKVAGLGKSYSQEDTMETMSNSGVKTSLRLLVFGFVSGFIVLAIISRFS